MCDDILNFNVLFASHATNGNCYITEAFLQIETEEGDGDEVWCNCVLEDCDAPNDFTFYTNGITYTLKCRWDKDSFKYEAFKGGEKIDEEHFTISGNRARYERDDGMWEVLGFHSE